LYHPQRNSTFSPKPTYRKKDLEDHRFKHFIIASFLIDWVNYAPFYEAINSIRKKRLSKSEVENLFHRAIYAHRHVQIELKSGGKAAKEIEKLFQLLEQLNDRKNRGLYVNHSTNKLILPNEISRKELEEIIDLSESITEMTKVIVSTRMTPEQKGIIKEEAQEIAKQIREIRSREDKDK